jgi:hypothetical protein
MKDKPMAREVKFKGGWHRLLTIWGDVQPEVSAPHATFRALLKAARKNSEGGKNGVFHIVAYSNGDVDVTPFSGREIEG